MVFPRLRKVVLVHGCFCHQHSACREGRLPGTRLEYWKSKLERNQSRDAENLRALKKAGWKCLVVWECETKDRERLTRRLTDFLNT